MRRTAQKNSHNTAALAGRASHVGHEPFPLEQRIMHTPQINRLNEILCDMPVAPTNKET